MPDLEQSLQGRDLGHLKIIAELWGLDFSAPDAKIGLERLVLLLSDSDHLMEVIQDLPEAARNALYELREQEGRMSWALFTRRFGSLREIGPARRDRERPYRDDQAHTSEALWYRALIGRAFFDTQNGPEEFAYIPDDFLMVLPDEPTKSREPEPLGRPATPSEKVYTVSATDKILDNACTFLAGIRLGLDPALIDRHIIAGKTTYPLTAIAMEKLLRTAGLIDPAGQLQPDAVRRFLESSRSEAMLALFNAWIRSQEFNELRLTPGLVSEGEWRNDPLAARQIILDFLSSIPGGFARTAGEKDAVYWSLGSFVSSIHQKYPDFQRPAGDYDSWYLMDVSSGKYLRGFENWDQVDGELIRFSIGGPLHWLGILDLGFNSEPEPGQKSVLTAFRSSDLARDLLNHQPPAGLQDENGMAAIHSDGRVLAPRLLSRAARYQIARFSEWEGFDQETYHYRLTPGSLEKARQQGLTVQHLLSLLGRNSKGLPPSLSTAINNWESRGSEARFEEVMVLKVRNPEILQALRSSKISRFLGEILGPTSVEVRPGAWRKVANYLAEIGYLSESRIGPPKSN